jgi:hypothetical protein
MNITFKFYCEAIDHYLKSYGITNFDQIKSTIVISNQIKINYKNRISSFKTAKKIYNFILKG